MKTRKLHITTLGDYWVLHWRYEQVRQNFSLLHIKFSFTEVSSLCKSIFPANTVHYNTAVVVCITAMCSYISGEVLMMTCHKINSEV